MKLICKYEVIELDPTKVLCNCNAIKQNDMMVLEIDAGLASKWIKVQRNLLLSNPYPLPLMLKFSGKNLPLRLTKKHLKPSSKDVNICYNFTTPREEKQYRYKGRVYFAADLYFPLEVKLQVKQPRVKFIHNSHTHSKKKGITDEVQITPFSDPLVYEKLTIENISEVDVKLKLEISPGKPKMICNNLPNTMVDLKPSEQYIPKFQMKSLDETEETILFKITALDGDEKVIENLAMTIKVLSKWPNYELKKNLLEFQAADISSVQERHIVLVCTQPNLIISSVKVQGKYALTVKSPNIRLELKKEFKIPVKILPTMNLKEVIIELETNCEIPTRKHVIQVNIKAPVLVAVPEVLDTSVLRDSICLSLANEGNWKTTKSWKYLPIEAKKDSESVFECAESLIEIKSNGEKTLKFKVNNSSRGTLLFERNGASGEVETPLKVPILCSSLLNREPTDMILFNSVDVSPYLFTLYKEMMLLFSSEETIYSAGAVLPLIFKFMNTNCFQARLMIQSVITCNTMFKLLVNICLGRPFNNEEYASLHTKNKMFSKLCDETNQYPLKHMLMISSVEREHYYRQVRQIFNHYYPSMVMSPIKLYPLQRSTNDGLKAAKVLCQHLENLLLLWPDPAVHELQLIVTSMANPTLSRCEEDLVDTIKDFESYMYSIQNLGIPVDAAERFVKSRCLVENSFNSKLRSFVETQNKDVEDLTHRISSFLRNAPQNRPEDFYHISSTLLKSHICEDSFSDYENFFQSVLQQRQTHSLNKLEACLSNPKDKDLLRRLLDIRCKIIDFITTPMEETDIKNIISVSCNILETEMEPSSESISERYNLVKRYGEEESARTEASDTFSEILELSYRLLVNQTIPKDTLILAENALKLLGNTVTSQAENQKVHFKIISQQVENFLGTNKESMKSYTNVLSDYLDEFNNFQKTKQLDVLKQLKTFAVKKKICASESAFNMFEILLLFASKKEFKAIFDTSQRLLQVISDNEEENLAELAKLLYIMSLSDKEDFPEILKAGNLSRSNQDIDKKQLFEAVANNVITNCKDIQCYRQEWLATKLPKILLELGFPAEHTKFLLYVLLVVEEMFKEILSTHPTGLVNVIGKAVERIIVQLQCDVEIKQVKFITEVLQQNKSLTYKDHQKRLCDLISCFSPDQHMVKFSETIKIVSQYYEDTQRLGFQSPYYMFNAACKMLSQLAVPPLMINVMVNAQYICEYSLQVAKQQKFQHENVFALLRRITNNDATKDILTLAEYLVLLRKLEENVDAKELPGFVPLLEMLSFVSKDVLHLMRFVQEWQSKPVTPEFFFAIQRLPGLQKDFYKLVGIVTVLAKTALTSEKELCKEHYLVVSLEILSIINDTTVKLLDVKNLLFYTKSSNVAFIQSNEEKLVYLLEFLSNEELELTKTSRYTNCVWLNIFKIFGYLTSADCSEYTRSERVANLGKVMYQLYVQLKGGEHPSAKHIFSALASLMYSNNPITEMLAVHLLTMASQIQVNEEANNSDESTPISIQAKVDSITLLASQFEQEKLLQEAIIKLNESQQEVPTATNDQLKNMKDQSKPLVGNPFLREDQFTEASVQEFSKEKDVADSFFEVDRYLNKLSKILEVDEITPEVFKPCRLDVEIVINVLYLCYVTTEKLQEISQRLLYKYKLTQNLDGISIGRLFQQLCGTIKINKLTEMMWDHQVRIIKGNFRSKFKEINDNIKLIMLNVIKVLEECDGEKILLALENFGVNLTVKDDFYDFKINGNSSEGDLDLMIDDLKEAELPSEERGLSLAGNISFEAFKEQSFSLSKGTGSSWLDHEFKFKFTKRQLEERTGATGPVKRVRQQGYNRQQNEQEGYVKDTTIVPLPRSLQDVKIVSQFSRNQMILRKRLFNHKLTMKQREMLVKQKCTNWVTRLTEVKEMESIAEYKDPEKLPQVEEEKLRYLLLARLTRDFQSQCINIMTQLKRRALDGDDESRPEPAQAQTHKFLFLVDNSGSMNGDKMTLALNVLIVFLESMKRLEFQTAVVRYGGEQSQTTLKGFDTPLDEQRGQLIIEAFDASEKTRTADALHYVAETEELFGKEIEPNEHRFIVLISDGIWDQKDPQLYYDNLGRAGANLMVLTTHPRKDPNLQSVHNTSIEYAQKLLDNIAPDAWHGMDADANLDEQIQKIAYLIDNQLRNELKRQIKKEKSVEHNPHQLQELQKTFLSSDKDKQINALKYKQDADVEWGSSIFVSDIHKPLDFVESEEDEKLAKCYIKAYERSTASWISSEDMLISSDASSKYLTQTANVIENEIVKHAQLVSNLDSVIDNAAFPNNRPTRLVQDYHGSTFSLKGFIKFLCTDGQYKKIYKNMIGHPRKDYIVSVILDTSMSMTGMAAVGSIQVFLGLITALHDNNITFSLFKAGQQTSLVKDFNEEWDRVAKAKVYEAIDFNDSASNLADAVFQASIHCTGGSTSKIEKTIYIITDGYPSAPKKLRASLVHADTLGIQTVAIGVGYFTEGIFEYFPNFVVANNPRDIPDALHKFYCGEPKLGGIHAAVRKEIVKSITHKGKKMNLENAWEEAIFEEVYTEQIERTRNALHLAAAPTRNQCNEMRVDLCFVLDTTGSMRRLITMAKEKIFSITREITKSVKEASDKDAKVRVAFVGYKCQGQSQHLDHVDFTEDTEKVTDLIGNQHANGGSRGGTADKYDALQFAMRFQWTGLVKVLVLMADAPGNGPFCVGPEYSERDCHPERAYNMPGLMAQIARENIYFFYADIDDFTNHERENFRQQYIRHAPKEMKEKGFHQLKINSTKDGDLLAEMITDKTTEVIITEFL